eukprot:COSAG02_NODE_141_length_34311_cov_54.733135_5_plen_64_part_00
MVSFTGNCSSPRPMHSLLITAGRTKVTVPVEGSSGCNGNGAPLQAMFRVVVDQQIVEVFTGQT